MQTVLAAPGLTLLGSRASGPTLVHVVRRAEWIILAFLLYAPALTFFLAAPERLRTRLASLNSAVIVIYASLVCLDSAKPRLILEVIRDWLPLPAARNGSAGISRNGLVCSTA